MTGAGTPEPTRPTTAIDAIAEEWVTTVADLDPDIAVWIGIPGRHGEYADLSPAGHSRLVTAAKPAVAPWWADNSKEVYAAGCANLATALGNRKAGRTRMPRFKSKHRSRPTCRFTTGAFGLGADRRHIRLPIIGAVRTGESTRKLARKVESGAARIRSAILSWQRGRWHVSFSVQIHDVDPAPRQGGRVLGVDLGIKSLAVLSTGERVPNPGRLDAALRRLRRAQRTCARRRGPDRRTRVEPANRVRRSGPAPTGPTPRLPGNAATTCTSSPPASSPPTTRS